MNISWNDINEWNDEYNFSIAGVCVCVCAGSFLSCSGHGAWIAIARWIQMFCQFGALEAFRIIHIHIQQFHAQFNNKQTLNILH